MKIVVVGELNVDVILAGTDVMPEWNREKLIDSFDVVLGSSSAITACALASLGAEVHFVSVVGEDDFGRFCLRELDRMQVNTEHVLRKADLKTGVTLSFSTPRDRGLLTYPGSIPLLAPEHLPAGLLAEADHVHSGSYFLQDGMRPHWETLFAGLRAEGATTSFDTGWDVRGLWYREQIDRLLPHTDLFIPSEEEMMHIYGAESVKEAARGLPAGVHTVVVKYGKRGAMLFTREQAPELVSSFQVAPVDTTGAGDAFNAGLIYAYRSGLRGRELVRFANASGAISTLGIGGTGSLPTLEKVNAMLEEA
ncbi:carbohydrate kinase family protein [Paenibacillus cookii]|uniref:Sugar kinase n=1 Tax=Paenibacillus cookii TaxID=157839 RepID=A0ABQ4M088_9BACL|nr:carbohydrate kinase family protein [Paenibacillus cookii]GIO68945.1 sugar kinase [Paenibacillus cookii]